MTLEQLAYLGEISAAIAVIISLLYVAKQLGQHTEMMQVSASNDRIERDYALSNQISENREFAELWMKGGSQFHELDDVDKTRLIMFERGAIMHWYNMHETWKRGLLSDSDWHELKSAAQNFGQRQSTRESWTKFKNSFNKSFQTFMDEIFTT